VGHEALLRQFHRGFLADLVIGPVRLVVNESLLVVQQRVAQYQSIQGARTPGREVDRDAAREADCEQAEPARSGSGLDMIECRAVPCSAVSMSLRMDDRGSGLPAGPRSCHDRAQIEAQARYSGLGQAVRQPEEEAVLVSCDAAAMNQDQRTSGGMARRHQRASEVEAIVGAERGLGGRQGHDTFLVTRAALIDGCMG
jgi:hypothetical protein